MKINTRWDLMVLVFLIPCFVLIVGGAVSASTIKTTPINQPKHKITVDTSGFDLSVQDEKALAKAIKQSLLEYPEVLFDTDKYDLKSLSVEDAWGFGSLGVDSMPDKVKKKIESGEIADYSTPMHSVYVHKIREGKWEAELRNTTEFVQLIDATPDSLLTMESKEFWTKDAIISDSQLRTLSETATVQVAQTVNYKMPWPDDISRDLWNDGWHTWWSGGCSESAGCALDYGINSTDVSDHQLLVSAAGTVIDVCDDYVGDDPNYDPSINVWIQDADGVVMGYHHLLKSSYMGFVQDDVVVQGQLLGETKRGGFTYENDGCGHAVQRENSSHIHWGLPGDRALEIDGEIFEMYEAVPSTPDSTNILFIADVCEAEVFTDWVIESSCMLEANHTQLMGDVIVQNNSMLYIPDGVVLTMKFSLGSVGLNKLLVKNGSKILIEPQGKIQNLF